MTAIPPTEAPRNDKPRVLVVDDEYGPRESFAFTLSADFSVDTAERAAEALTKIAAHEYGAVLLDIRMPDMDGLRALKELRKIDPLVSVIIVTGHGTLSTAQEAMLNGANQYLRKPPDVAELIAAVRNQSEATRARRLQAKRAAEAMLETALLAQRISTLDADRTELVRQVRGLREQFDEHRQATAGMIHDAASHLSTGNALLEFLEDEMWESPGEAVKTSEALKRQLATSVTIMRRLMAASSSGGVTPAEKKQDAEMFLLAEQLEQLSSRAVEKRGIKFVSKVEVATRSLPLRASQIDLLQVASNLIKNAVEATVGGGTILAIYGGPFSRDEVLRMSDRAVAIARFGEANARLWGVINVQDSGSGMSAKTSELLFRERVTTKRDGTGHGLLSSAKTIMGAGGFIFAHSTLGQGTKFSVAVPTA